MKNSDRLVIKLPPIDLSLVVLSHLLAALGELWIAVDRGDRGYVPLIGGNALLFAQFFYKAVRKHLLAHVFDGEPNSYVLFQLCPVGMAVVGLAYTLKALGLMFLSIEHEDPRYLVVMMTELLMILLLATRVVRRWRVVRRRLLTAHPSHPRGRHPARPRDASVAQRRKRRSRRKSRH